MHTQMERRCYRKEDSAVALRRFLQGATLRLGYSALILGDQNGKLIAWAGEHKDPEKTAQSAPLLFSQCNQRQQNLAADGKEPFIEAIFTTSNTLFLTALGGRTRRPIHTGGVLSGIQRILKDH